MKTAAQDVGTQPVASTERIVDARDLQHADVTAQARSSALLCASADGGDAEEEGRSGAVLLARTEEQGPLQRLKRST